MNWFSNQKGKKSKIDTPALGLSKCVSNGKNFHFIFRLLIALPLMLTLLCASLPGIANAMRGKASWYGTTAHGKMTANGETFNRYSLTAAHRTLPFGTVLRVFNEQNGSNVLVRVNDRGPYSKGRVVDVSFRAAKKLDMTDSGVAPVRIEIVSDKNGEPLKNGNSFYIHILSESDAKKAIALAHSLEKRLKQPVHAIAADAKNIKTNKICVGPYADFHQAQKDFVKLEERKIELAGIIEAPTTQTQKKSSNKLVAANKR